MCDIRMAKMKKAKDIKVGDKLVKFVNGKTKHAEVTSVETVEGEVVGVNICIRYSGSGFVIVRPHRELEVV